MNTFYRLYEQSQDATMEQVRDYAAKTGEEIRLDLTADADLNGVDLSGV